MPSGFAASRRDYRRPNMRFLITATSDPQAPASDRPLDDETFTDPQSGSDMERSF
jgi:hypothetical protein